MRILARRGPLRAFLFFVRWQLLPVLLALPGHLAFVLRGAGDPRSGAWRRLVLAGRLIGIHLRIECAHAPLELLAVVEEIVSLPATRPGVVVECGTWLGACTAKLSLACALAGRRLLACDSFEGLPEVRAADRIEGQEPFARGDFATRLEIVRENVARLGDVSVVELVPGWYRDSLPKLPASAVACAFLDVDLKESIEDCLRGLWRRLAPGAKLFVHDVDRPAVVEPFRDTAWWEREIGGETPRFEGALIGIGWQRRLIGYAAKG